MLPTLIGTVVIAGLVGFFAEKSGFTRNGYLASTIICVGGAFLFYFVRLMFGFGFSSAGMNATRVGAIRNTAIRHAKSTSYRHRQTAPAHHRSECYG